MATYRKVEIVEAAQYEGPPLTVIHDHLGEQKAQSGDWLLGTERGKIRVVSAKQFAAEFKPYVEAESSKISENAYLNDRLSELTGEIASIDLSRANLQTALDDAMEQIAALKKQLAALNKQLAANTEVIREHPVSHAKTPVKTAAKKK